MVTAEFAVALPAVMLVLTLCVGAVSVVLDQVRCTDAARVGARALARGDHPARVHELVTRLAPRGSTVELARGTTSRVEVRARPSALLGPLGSAVAAHAFGEAVTEDAEAAP